MVWILTGRLVVNNGFFGVLGMKPLLTVKEASQYLQMHKITVYKLINNGELLAVKKAGMGIRLRKTDLDEWLERGSLLGKLNPDYFTKIDLALDEYDKLLLKGVTMSQSGKIWHYPFGSVYYRLTKSGIKKWYYYYRVNGKRIRKVVPYAQSRAEALKVLHAKVADSFRGLHGFKKERKKITFNQLAELYLEKYAKLNKKSWRSGDKSYLDAHLCPFFGEEFIADITPLMIEEYREKRRKEVSKSTVNRELAVMRKMFNLAIDWELAEANPVARIKFYSESDTQKERVLISEEEQRLLAECADHLRPIVVTALNTGMRRGEALKLMWGQVDLQARIIEVTGTKGGKDRIIPINAALYLELRKLKNQNGTSDYVFVNPKTNGPYGDVKNAFNAACERAKIEGLRFHDLRHTFATRLVQAGVDIITVKELLGHSSVRVTERYTHSNKDSKHRAVSLLAIRLRAEDENVDRSVPLVSARESEESVSHYLSAN